MRALTPRARRLGAVGAAGLALLVLLPVDEARAEGEEQSVPSDALVPPRDVTLKRAHRLVEVEANTRKNLEEAVGLYRGLLDGDDPLTTAQKQAALTDLSRAYLRLGDLERGPARKAAYEKGVASADAALALGETADALFWRASNLASSGREDGLTKSAWLVPKVKANLERALALDPNYHYARFTLAEVDRQLPRLMGGGPEKARAHLEEIRRRDPHFTPSKVLLAQLLVEAGEKAEARRVLEEVVAETRPSVPNDWRKFNRPEAKRLLQKLSED